MTIKSDQPAGLVRGARLLVRGLLVTEAVPDRPTTDQLARILAKHQLGGILPGGVLCTCGEELATLNPPLDDGTVKGEPLALAVHQLQEMEAAQ